MDNNLPTYKISIDPSLSEDGTDLGITQIAYTSEPAIITKGLAFDTNKPLKFTDTLKYRLAAPAIIPDLPIYRQDEELGEYNVIFNAETIEELRQKFMMNKGQVVFNLDHTTEEAPSYILDSWITGEPETDPSFTKYGIKVPAGSWFVVSQFTDKEFFINEIVNKDRNGYSIEGFLGLSLNKIKQKLNKNTMKENKESKIKALLAELLKLNESTEIELASAELKDGTKISISKLEVGGDVTTIDENGTSVPLMDGEHKLKDGSTLVKVAGKITEIKDGYVVVKGNCNKCANGIFEMSFDKNMKSGDYEIYKQL